MNAFNIEKIKNSTPIQFIEFHPLIDSTNNRAKELLKQPVLPGLPLLVLAAAQTAGRGRGSKSWWTGQGSLALSIGLDLSETSLDRSDLTELSPRIGRVVAELVASRIPDRYRTKLKLPNDVYVDGRKIAGILIESPTPKRLVVGIGLNVNNRFANAPEEFKSLPIATLYDILDEELDLTEVAVELLLRFFQDFEHVSDTRPLFLGRGLGCRQKILGINGRVKE